MLYRQQHQKLTINEDYHDSLGGIGEARLLNAEKDGYIDDKAYYISQYDGKIFFMDEQIGTIISFLKKESL